MRSRPYPNLGGNEQIDGTQAVKHLWRPLRLNMGFLVGADQLRRYPAFPSQQLPPLPLEKIDLRGLADARHSDVTKMPKDAMTLQLPELLARRWTLHAGRAGELVNGEKLISLNVEKANRGAVC